MDVVKVKCATCPREFRVMLRNGIKASRKCAACAVTRRHRRGIRRVRDPRKRLDVNWPVTLAFRFRDKNSVVCFDGRFELHGKDMSRMREEILHRDGYMCVLCTSQVDLEIDHVESKGKSLHDDRPQNLRVLCRSCHLARHPEKQTNWSRKGAA